MKLSDDASSLIIHNLKPKLHPQYTNETDPEEINRIRRDKLGSKAAGLDGE